jgi:mono/diheme cytochrome c family protein
MFKRLILGLLVLAFIGVAGVFILAWHSSIEPISPPSISAFDTSQIARGEILASAGYCTSCHTVAGGPALAGGRAMKTGFGTIYSTNITPDPASGIGAWSLTAFTRALREGIARDGSELYPAFPFDHFTRLTDGDIAALYAYLMTQPAVVAPAHGNDLAFPLNIRALQAGWKLLFLDRNEFRNAADKSDEWNRGAYLAEALGHCGACHTPRNALGAEIGERTYAGALIDGWQAPPLDANNSAALPWTVDELARYLRNGGTALHGAAAGPMSAVHIGLSALPEADIRAIAIYFADRNGSRENAASDTAAISAAMHSAQLETRESYTAGADLYRSACSSCHYNSAVPPSLLRPELALNSALRGDDPTNLIQVILHGVGASEGISGAMMPPFASALSDSEIAALASYLRSTQTDRPPWTDLSERITAVRRDSAGP